MSLKPAALIAHDGKTSIKINRHRVNRPGTPRFSSIRFGHDQTRGVAGGLEAVKILPSGG